MAKSKPLQKIKHQSKRGRGGSQQRKVWSLPGPLLQLLPLLFLIVATLFVFWSVKNHEFTCYDDDAYVTENLHVQAGLTLKGVLWAFSTTWTGNWHPLTWLSHMLDCQLFGLNPEGHHLTSLFFHTANTFLLFLVLKRMTGKLWASIFVAALFALHPLHVESVAWVAERKDVLSTFFWMLTIWMYIRYVERPGFERYLLAILCFALGLFSKPMLVTLPFVLLLLDYWPLGRFSFRESRLIAHIHEPNMGSDKGSFAFRLILEKVPFFLLSAASSALTFFTQMTAGAVGSLERCPIEVRLANAIVSYARYMEKMIWPHNLAVLYPYPDAVPLWQVGVAGVLLLGISLLVIRFARRRPHLLVGWFWYLGILVPVIGLVQVGEQAMADRYTYVALVGLFIMIAMDIPNILKEWRYRKIALFVSACLILSLLTMMTCVQIRYWQNSITLFEHTLAVTERNFTIHNNLGVALIQQGKIQEATAHYKQALRTKPNFAEAHNNLGIVLAQQGKIEEAAAHYEQALRIKLDYAEAHNNLGSLLVQQGKTQEAAGNFTRALQIKPKYAEAHYNLGSLLVEQGKIEEAAFHYTKALRIKPDFVEAHRDLGIILVQLGKYQEAIDHFSKAGGSNQIFQRPTSPYK